MLGERLIRALTLDDIGPALPARPRPRHPASDLVERATALWRLTNSSARIAVEALAGHSGTPLSSWCGVENLLITPDVSGASWRLTGHRDASAARACFSEQMYPRRAHSGPAVGFLNLISGVRCCAGGLR